MNTITNEQIPVKAPGSPRTSTEDNLIKDKINEVIAVLNSKTKENPFLALKGDLEGGISTSLLLLGDSTGNSNNEWLYLFIQELRGMYPNFTFKYHLWDDTIERYADPVYLQGTGERYAVLTGQDNSNLRLPKSEFGNVTGNLDFRIKIRAADYAPASNTVLGGTAGAAGNRGWYFFIEATTGRLRYAWSEDGTALKYASSAVAPSGLIDNVTDIWFRVAHILDNGAGGNTVNFFSSTDGKNWAGLGAGVVTEGVTSIFESTQDWELGLRGATAERFTGRIYEAIIMDEGFTVTPASIDSWIRDSDAVTFAGNPVFNIYNGSHPGAGIEFLNQPIRFNHMAPLDNFAAIMLSCSHNDGFQIGRYYLGHWDIYLQMIKDKLKTGNIILTTQNPKAEPAPYIEEHGKRRGQLIAWAKRNHIDVIDAYYEFLKGDLSELVAADGIHPTNAGSLLWANTVMASFNQA